MPNRIIKDEILKSERLGNVSIQARWAYLGLILLADDYGRLEAHSRMMRIGIFPHDDMVGEREFARWIDDLCSVDALLRYSVGGKLYIQIQRWKNTPRAAESKFPAPPSALEVVAATSDADESLTSGDVNLGKDANKCAQPRAEESICLPLQTNAPVTVTDTVTNNRNRNVPAQTARSSVFVPAKLAKRADGGRGLEAGSGKRVTSQDKREVGRRRAAFCKYCGGKMEDLSRDDFVERAFRHAVNLDFVPDSEGGRQWVFAAAEECLRSGKTFGLFVKLVCEDKSGITNEADILAGKRIQRSFRGERPAKLSKAQEALRDRNG